MKTEHRTGDMPQNNGGTSELTRRQKRGIKDYVGLGAKGVAMGACDVVPGVSGGTMAFILGIYEELISSIRAIARKEFLGSLFRFQLKEAARAINLPFLLAVLSGIVIAVVSLAKLMEWLLQNQPVYLWSFFFGLIIASVIVVSKRIPKWNLRFVILLIITAIGAYILVGLVPAQTPDDYWFIFLSGGLAICAMILPGISGSFILLLLRKYEFIVGRIAKLSNGTFETKDGIVLAIFALGCGVGLVTFAQLLGWLFKRYHDLTVAMLTGLMVGGLRKVWPWKETVESVIDRHGELIPIVQENFFPGFGGEFVIALGLALVGFVMVILIERIGMKGIGDHL